MIQTKEDLRRYLNTELKYYEDSRIKRIFNVGEKAILYKHQLLLRKTEYYINTKKRLRTLIYRARLAKIQNKYLIHVPTNTCEEGLKIIHVGPILISGKARLGKNCALHINTGVVAGGIDNGAPCIKDNVVIGIGAVVLGSITISSGVAIGANAVVNKDVLEENIAVAGVPAKKISNNGRNCWKKN